MKRTTTLAAAIITITTALTGCAMDAAGVDSAFTGAEQFGSIEGTLASTCVLETAGSDSTCMSAAAWKTQLTGVCSNAGGDIGAVGYADACGNGLWRRAKFQCCGMPTLPETQETCGTSVTGSQDVCLSVEDWKDALQNQCANGGADLTNFSFQQQCAGGFRFATYTCCDGAAEPAPAATTPADVANDAPTCQMQLLGNGSMCQPVSHWDEQAAAACGDKVVDTITLGAACGNDTYTFASATCCTADADSTTVTTSPTTPVEEVETNQPEVTTAPQTETVCGNHELGDGLQCKSASDWRDLAVKFCGQSNAYVGTIDTANECKGGTNYARITCCQEVEI